MLRALFISFAGAILIFMSACSGEQAAKSQADYDTTKKMVVDILQTEDGKKALAEILSDKKMKQQLIMNDEAVKQAISEVLASEKSKKMWQKLFEDPKFVESYTKSMADENKKLVKELMNDAEFQKQILELLQNPEMDEQILKVLKSQKFRAHLEETIKQSLETPLFEAKITDMLLKAVKEQGKSKKEGESKDDSSQDKQKSADEDTG